MAFCAMQSPQCVVIVARDLAAMKDSYCGPQPFDAMADARRVYAVLKEQPSGTGTLRDAEVHATTQLWPCKKS